MNKTLRVIVSIIVGTLGLLSVGLAARFLPTIEGEPYFGIVSYIVPFIYISVLTMIFGLSKNYTHIDVAGLRIEKRSPWITGLRWGIMPLIILGTANVVFTMLSLSRYGITSKPGMAVTFMILTSLCIAIFEESLFRNIVFSVLKGKDNSYFLGFLGSSILFGLFHLGNLTVPGYTAGQVAVQVGYTFMLGLFFSGLMLATRSLLIPIVAHWIVDVTGNVNVLFNASPIQQGSAGPNLISVLLMVATTLPAMIAGIMMYRRYVIRT